MSALENQPWETGTDFILARANYMACAYNAAVNYGSERAMKKMRHLIEAINAYHRVEGVAKLNWLKEQGIIDSWSPCPVECEMRPGGLFHAKGCENDFNSDVSRARREAVRDQLPEKFYWSASPSLVGTPS